MSLLSPTLQRRLGRLHLRAAHADASRGTGERRSRLRGAGIEFADHRLYQPGDDIRYLDPHAYARLRQHHIKLYSVYQALEVTIVRDASASMDVGSPTKHDVAGRLAAALAYTALAGGDTVAVATVHAADVAWSGRLQGVQRTPELFARIEGERPAGTTALGAAARRVAGRLPVAGLVIVISDWLAPDSGDAVRALAGAGHEVVGVQLLAPEELEPERLGHGPTRLVDTETGERVDLALTAQAFRRYRDELEAERTALARSLTRRGGRLLTVRSDQDLERVLLHDWRSARFLM